MSEVAKKVPDAWYKPSVTLSAFMYILHRVASIGLSLDSLLGMILMQRGVSQVDYILMISFHVELFVMHHSLSVESKVTNQALPQIKYGKATVVSLSKYFLRNKGKLFLVPYHK